MDSTEIVNTVTELVSRWGLKVVGALTVLIVGWMAAKMARNAMRRALDRSKLDPTLVPFLTKLVYYSLLVFVVVAVLNLFGIQTTSFIAVLGAAGLAVGLALQGTLTNFASGVMLLIFRPFKVGDYVEAGGESGSVQEIGIFVTTLNSPDNVRIIVANSAIFTGTIKNYATNPTRRIDMVIGVSYDDDLGKALETIRRVVTADERVLQDPAPVIAVSELADSSVDFVVRPWCKKEDYWGLRCHLTLRLKEELEAAGCSMPYPTSDVHIHRVDGPSAA